MLRLSVVATVAAVLLAARPASACTTLCMSRGKEVIVAKSYDFNVGNGLVLRNRRGVAKEAMLVSQGKAKPSRWVSRYGSLTFNQYGRELPLGGMNERGLVVEIMWLTATRHPPLAADKEAVNELQLIQYLLDSCATTREAVAAAKRLQIDKVHAPVHYMVCDRAGQCATIEDIGGNRVIHRGKTLPVRVLTNNPYAASLRYLRRHKGFGGKEAIPHTPASLARFARAATHARAFTRSKGDRRIAAFSALEDVRQGDFTKWQIVYEPLRGEVSFRKAGEDGFTTAKVEAKDCNAPVEVMDLFGTLIKGKRAFVPYTFELNRTLIQKSFKELGARFPPPVLEMLARYPEALKCTHGAKEPKKP